MTRNVHYLATARAVPGYGERIMFACEVCKQVVGSPDTHAIIAHHAESISVDSSRPYGNVIEDGPMNRRNHE